MDELRLLSRLRPVVDDPDPVVLAKHRSALLRHTADPRPARARRWRLLRPALIAPVLAGIVVIALVTWPSGTPAPPLGIGTTPPPAAGTPPTSVARVLDLAARTAETAPVGHGAYAYTNTMTVYHDAGTRVVRTQSWINRDGTDGLIREDRDGHIEEHSLGGCDNDLAPRRTVCSGSGPSGPPSLYNQTYDYLATLPTDPQALRAEIYAQVQQDYDGMGPNASRLYTVDQWVYQMIGNLVREALPPALKAALYRVAETIPGVEFVPDITDAAGRHGVGVAHSVNNAGDRTILIFDRTTYQVLGFQADVGDGRGEGDALLATGLVEGIGQTP